MSKLKLNGPFVNLIRNRSLSPLHQFIEGASQLQEKIMVYLHKPSTSSTMMIKYTTWCAYNHKYTHLIILWTSLHVFQLVDQNNVDTQVIVK